VIWAVLPLTVFSFFLQYTHTLRPDMGGLSVGQSTFGDLCLHLSIITSLRNAPFPPEYTLLPGTRLAYPFLADSLSTSLMLWGMPLRWSVMIPGTLMMAMVYMGIMILAERLTHSRTCALCTLLLLVFCGGFGFLYQWDGMIRDPSRFIDIFAGFYKTPANQPTLNLYWSNLLADLFLPQRTFLGGWALLLPALYSLVEMVETHSWRETFLLTFFASALPLVHTHSFLALGLCSAGWIVAALIRREGRRILFGQAVVYLTLVLCCALPQLLAFTFPQSAAEGFLRFRFNWVNNPNGMGLTDPYLYFWVKNVGPPLLLLLLALFDLKAKQRPWIVGAFTIFIVAELVLFQPNAYDNNKLFYVWYLLSLPFALQYGARVYHQMECFRSRTVLATVFLACSMLSGSLALMREAISTYQLFWKADIALADYVENQTPPDAVFMTATNHNNAVSALAGRRVVCGPSLYLYFHGLDYGKQENDIRRFYESPAEGQSILTENNVRYIVLGDAERAQYNVSEAVLDALYPLVFESFGTRLYAVP